MCTNNTAPSVSSINRILRNRAAERAAAEYAHATQVQVLFIIKLGENLKQHYNCVILYGTWTHKKWIYTQFQVTLTKKKLQSYSFSKSGFYINLTCGFIQRDIELEIVSIQHFPDVFQMSPLAPDSIRVQLCVCFRFWTNRNSMTVTSIFLSISLSN